MDFADPVADSISASSAAPEATSQQGVLVLTQPQPAVAAGDVARNPRRRLVGKSFASFDDHGSIFSDSKCITHSDDRLLAFPEYDDGSIPAEKCVAIDEFIEADSAVGGSAVATWTALLHGSMPALSGRSLPQMLRQLVQRVIRNRSVLPAASQRCA